MTNPCRHYQRVLCTPTRHQRHPRPSERRVPVQRDVPNVVPCTVRSLGVVQHEPHVRHGHRARHRTPRVLQRQGPQLSRHVVSWTCAGARALPNECVRAWCVRTYVRVCTYGSCTHTHTHTHTHACMRVAGRAHSCVTPTLPHGEVSDEYTTCSLLHQSHQLLRAGRRRSTSTATHGGGATWRAQGRTPSSLVRTERRTRRACSSTRESKRWCSRSSPSSTFSRAYRGSLSALCSPCIVRMTVISAFFYLFLPVIHVGLWAGCAHHPCLSYVQKCRLRFALESAHHHN
jgi:hypothetical protein